MESTHVTRRLALDGGEPAIKHPLPPMFPGGLRIGSEEEDAVLATLRSKRLFRYYGPTAGPSQAEQLEVDFANRMGVKHAIGVTCGSSALLCALMGIGVGPGDEVIIPAYTWIASATAVIAVGAVPVIAEIDDSLMLDPVDAERKITSLTKAIIAVHMRGAPCDMDALSAVAQRHGVKLVEDVAQACGGSFGGRQLGTIGDVGAFSFQFNKIITAGEGGMVTTNDDTIRERVLQCQDVAAWTRYKLPEDQSLPGTNHRLSELHAAVLGVQLGRLDGILSDMRDRKTRIKLGIDATIRQYNLSYRTLNDPEGDTAVAIIVSLPTAGIARSITAALGAEGLKSMVLYRPDVTDLHVACHWDAILGQRTWTDKGGPWRWHEGTLDYRKDAWPRSTDLLGRSVQINVSPDLTSEQVDEVIEGVNKVIPGVLAREEVKAN